LTNSQVSTATVDQSNWRTRRRVTALAAAVVFALTLAVTSAIGASDASDDSAGNGIKQVQRSGNSI
jgi:hypothetical protein